MKKKSRHAIFRVEIRKWGKIMLVNLILVLLSGVSLYAQSESSRQQRITAKYQNKTILEVLEDLKTKTGYTFVHKQNDISNTVKITETFTNATLDDVLKKVLTAHGYDYSIEGKVIVVKKKAKEQQASAREIITVKGRVVDEKGNPMPGVSVVINQTTRGVATDHRGNYDILVRTDDVLKFSFIGYKDATIPVEGKTVLNVTLEPAEEALEEVTVVAYGEQKRESVVGAVTTVNVNSLKTSNSDLTASFVGRIPGMIGYLKGGMPGALREEEMQTQFSIRGITSFGNNANTAPLILLDGVEVSVLDLSRIDPEDIDSFSVLKDASATAMYGARGANGVILVSTKKGAEGSVYTAFRYEAIASMPTKKIDVVDPITYMRAYNEALQTRDPLVQPKYTAERINNTGSDRFPSWVYPANDWYKLLFKNTAINHHLGLSVRGGTKIMQYYASLSHNYDEGMLKTDRLNSFDVNIRNNTTALRINLNIDMTPSAKLVLNSNSTLDAYRGPLASVQQAYSLAFNANPVDYAAVYPADATYSFPHIRFGYETKNSNNPYASIQAGYLERSRFATINRVEYIQNWGAILKGLETRANVSLYKEAYYSTPFETTPYQYRLADYNHQTGEHTLEQLVEGDKNLTVNTIGKVTEGETQVAGEFRAFYNGNWGDHTVSYTGLFNLSQRTTSTGRTLFSAIKNRNMGLSMRLSYGYKERYYLEGSFGYNGPERFAKHNRFGFFPAIGFSYMLSKEPFIANATGHWLSFLKVRASYGKVGNDGIGDAVTDRYTQNVGRYIYLENIGLNSQDQYVIFSYANPTIQWEIAEQTNLGVEATFFDGLLDFTVDFYEEIRHNILSSRTIVPASMGLGLYPFDNVGKVRSRGIDFSGKIQHAFSNDFWFILNGTATYNKSVFKEIEEAADKPEWQGKVGHDISQVVGYIAEGLFQSQEEIDRSPLQSGDYMPGDIRYRDVNGDGKISIDDAVHIGYPTEPRFVYGFNGTVSYKRFEFNFAFQGASKRSLFIEPSSLSPFVNDRALLSAIWEDHWTPENMKANPLWPRLSTSGITAHNMEEARIGQETLRASTYFMREVKFLRCQSLELAYSLPTRWVKKIGLQRLKPYIRVNNPFLISDFDLWDVELGSSGFNYPIQRTYSVGVNLSF